MPELAPPGRVPPASGAPQIPARAGGPSVWVGIPIVEVAAAVQVHVRLLEREGARAVHGGGAGGECVAVGARARRWWRYVDPRGTNAEAVRRGRGGRGGRNEQGSHPDCKDVTRPPAHRRSLGAQSAPRAA